VTRPDAADRLRPWSTGAGDERTEYGDGKDNQLRRLVRAERWAGHFEGRIGGMTDAPGTVVV